MFATVVTTPAMKPAIQLGSNSGRIATMAPKSSSQRIDQLIQLIDLFSPDDVSKAALMAETTYLQSQAPASVTAAMIATLLANQHMTSAATANCYLLPQASPADLGTRLNINC